ncbi:hypothetical protein GCM10010282_31860 [Streptomyces roseolus]|nr:hypothetical protein GCM10010282_31860 [Streptomyces roseolus]
MVGLHQDDGSPPYDVRRSGTGRVTLFFPDPDARLPSVAPSVRDHLGAMQIEPDVHDSLDRADGPRQKGNQSAVP